MKEKLENKNEVVRPRFFRDIGRLTPIGRLMPNGRLTPIGRPMGYRVMVSRGVRAPR